MSYWTARAEARERIYNRAELEAVRAVHLAAERSRATLRREMDDIMRVFAKRNWLSRADAKALLEQPALPGVFESLQGRVDKLSDKGKRFVKAQVEAPAYRARLSRAQAMSDSIAVSVAEVADVKERATKEVMQRVMQEAHGRTSYDIQMSVGRLMPYDGMDSNAVSEVLRQRWSGGNYSSRIWGGAGNLAASLRGAMLENLMMGRTSDETYRELYKLSQSDELATNRLIRTESSYAANQAIAQAYEDAGFERYVFVSALEARTCPKCGAMDGESFPLSEKKVGKNYPPVHPWCRCTTKPDDEDLKALEKDSSRWARDPEAGEFVKVRGDMTYKEWKAEQERIHGEKSFSAMQKKVWNLKRDKKQLEKYQKLIGLNRFTQDIKAFQNMKYGDKEVYSLVKLDYRRQLTLKKCPNLALPNAGQATIADTKFTGYLFNPENKKGWVKGVAFTSRLGYDISNWQELQKELLACATKYPAIRGETNEHGTKHTQKAVLYGKKDKPANVVIGWKCKDEKSWMTTTYIREVSKDD